MNYRSIFFLYLHTLGVKTLSAQRSNAKRSACFFQALSGRLSTCRVLTLSAVLCLLLCGCDKEEFTSKYSTKYRVMCGFTVASYQELMPAVGGFGIFATIRQSGGEIFMECENLKSPAYKLDALQKDFRFGCGGLIVGRDRDGIMCCFDLACPNCDQAQYRLKVKDQQATCSNCGIVYGLVDSPTIIDIGKGLHPSPRGLYQYYPVYNGTEIHIMNTPNG